MNSAAIKKGLALLCLGCFAFCGKNIVFNHVQSPVEIFYDRATSDGRAYVSLGNILVEKRKFGIGSFFLFPLFPWGITWGGAGRFWQGMQAGATGQVAADDIMVGLNELLLARAQEMGATAVINVSYSEIEVPIMLPWFGPFTRHYFVARGEAVRFDAGGAPPGRRPAPANRPAPAPNQQIQQPPNQQAPYNPDQFDPYQQDQNSPPEQQPYDPGGYDPNQYEDPGYDPYPQYDPYR